MNISHQIKLCRENKGYSQEYLAEKLYISRQTISNWENERSYPDVHNLIMMCELFNVSLDDLVQGEIHMEQRELVKKKFDFWTYIMLILLIGSLILLGPLIVFLVGGALLYFYYCIWSGYLQVEMLIKLNIKMAWIIMIELLLL
ncbi:helix-turn-helix domain-containing protein [Pseudomonas aeruginosa]|nr:helix-turn-helix domain-containing protein [Pseudomonas aeruginosa]